MGTDLARTEQGAEYQHLRRNGSLQTRSNPVCSEHLSPDLRVDREQAGAAASCAKRQPGPCPGSGEKPGKW